MQERVVILFVRPTKRVLLFSSEGSSLVIPSGQIEKRDYGISFASYIEHAFHRIVYELFGGTIIPLQYEYVKKQETAEVTEHIFFVFAWDGTHPQFVLIGGQTAKCSWVVIDKAMTVVDDPDGVQTLHQLQEAVRIRSLLHR